MTVSFIGAGNIASHYAKELFEAGCKIDSILSKRLRSAKSLASIVNAHATTSFRNLSRDSNYYILAVPDEIIEKVTIALAEYVNSDAIIIHTSGATELKTILTHFKHAGFAWPPQSISKEKDIDFNKVPICIGATDKKTEKSIIQLMSLITKITYKLDDKQKLALHLAAVFANNFSNHMFQLAYDICKDHKLDFQLLYPILLETSNKVIGNIPNDVQTGPAVRQDLATLQKHLHLLKTDSDKKKIYKLLSESIKKSNS